MKTSRKGRPLCDEHDQTIDLHPNCFKNELTQTKTEKNFSGDRLIITTRSANIKTLEESLKFNKVDLKKWNVERHITNSWEVTLGKNKTGTGKPETYTNFQVKVDLKLKKPLETALESVVKRLEKHKLVPTKKLPKPSGDCMLEISLFDAHFGKLCWEPESGDNYDLKIAEKVYLEAVSELLAKTKHYNIEKIVFPIGNDFFHINSPDNKTPASGNPLTVDGRLPKVFEAGIMATVKAIDKCLSVAPVEVLWIPGNHDPETSYYLAKVIEAHYNNVKQVKVDASPKGRKYILYGVNALMFTHSPKISGTKKGGLALIMAGEEPEMWAKSKHREIHTGHFHTAQEIDYFSADTYGPVRVRVLPSLSGTDMWHYEQGYVKTLKAAEAYLWHKTNGYEAHFSTSVKAQ